ncbi:MAG: M24 family metallopeptidase [Kofleriaceae bacterium]
MTRRTIATLLLSLVPTLASAQPRKLPEADDPYAEKPTDPYADPQAPAPAPAKKPAKKKGPAEQAPVPNVPTDPYAEPIAPTPPVVPPPKLPAKVEMDLPLPPGTAKKKTPTPSDDPYVDSGIAKTPAPPAPKTPAKSPAKQPDDPYAEPVKVAVPARVGIEDLVTVQGLLAVQRLDGWLLFDRDGENPIASRLVSPDGHPTRSWFYLLPSRGEPTLLVHTAELRSFDHVKGKKLTYQGHRDLPTQLKALLKGQRTVAIEYSAKASVPSVSRVDAGTVELIKAAGVQVRTSETLVQFTKAIWGDAGRTAHYVAVHHIVEMRKEALAYAAKQLAAGAPLTEYDLQQRLTRAMTMRGLAGAPPVVAAGVNTADPYYVPSAAKNAPIKRGDLIVISLAAKVNKPDGIWAAQTWVAIAETGVPAEYAKAFDVASLARDQAIVLITDRNTKRRPVTGADVDNAARGFLEKAGFKDKILHRTGHSIDNDFQGGGADLDNFEVRDTRILTPGTGFTVGPGLYFAGQFGVRAEVSVFFAPSGPEITTPAQNEIEALFAR